MDNESYVSWSDYDILILLLIHNEAGQGPVISSRDQILKIKNASGKSEWTRFECQSLSGASETFQVRIDPLAMPGFRPILFFVSFRCLRRLWGENCTCELIAAWMLPTPKIWQGTVNFANDWAIVGIGFDAVFFEPRGPLGPEFSAQLQLADGTNVGANKDRIR